MGRSFTSKFASTREDSRSHITWRWNWRGEVLLARTLDVLVDRIRDVSSRGETR